jgi:hypothetical protein
MTDFFSNTNADSDAESETEFECLFKEKNPEESVFYFKRIDVQRDTGICNVTFTFNFDNTVDLSCSLIIAENLSNIELEILDRMFLAIGLCALPWYWMGFASRRIVIEESVSASALAIHNHDHYSVT